MANVFQESGLFFCSSDQKKGIRSQPIGTVAAWAGARKASSMPIRGSTCPYQGTRGSAVGGLYGSDTVLVEVTKFRITHSTTSSRKSRSRRKRRAGPRLLG